MDPAIGAALISAGGQLAGNGLGLFSSPTAANHSAYKYAKRLMAYQNELQQNYASFSAIKLPGMNRLGMELAGFNPILAINSGTGEQGNSSIGNFNNQGDDRFSNFGSGIAQTIQNTLSSALQLKRFEAETGLLDAQIKQVNAQTAESIYRTKHPSTVMSFLSSLTDPKHSRVANWIEKLLDSVSAKTNFQQQINYSNHPDHPSEFPLQPSPFYQ